MKKVFVGLLFVVVLAVAVVVPISAEMSSEEQAEYDAIKIYCPNNSNHVLGTWGELKYNCSEGSVSVFCPDCGDNVSFDAWYCGYCQLKLPNQPDHVCPNCHAGADNPVDEMEYGSDARRIWYEGSIYGYGKGASAGSVTSYEAGYEAGYNQGKQDAQESSGGAAGGEQPGDITQTDAYQAGYEAGREAMMSELEASATTNKFYTAGAAAGYKSGYDSGYAKGKQDGYSSGYSKGYSAGYAANQAALKKAQQEAAAAKARYDSAYQEGVQAEVSKNFISIVGEIAAAPFHAVQNMFNFEIFGLNVASVLLAIFTAIIVVAVIALVLKFVL